LAAVKPVLCIFFLLILPPAFAQLDGGGGEKFEPQVEELDLGEDVEEELLTDPTAKPGEAKPPQAEDQPAPGTLDPPKTAKPSAAPGKRKKYQSNDNVIFDWSKHQNATEVPHPFVEKGLLRVTRDRTYIYRVSETEQKIATQIHIGPYNPENLEAPPNDDGFVSTFDDNYDQTDNPAVMLNWEWQLWRSPIGKWGATAGFGVYVAQGNGHFAGTKNTHLTPREIFTLAVVPVNLGVVYRLQIWNKQLFVPYGMGGGTLIGFSEFRDDGKPPKWGGSYAAYFGGGLALNLTYFDAISKIQLDREYGINAVYLTAEYRRFAGLSNNFDFSSDFANAGFLMEY
jgi:hypothetical protein